MRLIEKHFCRANDGNQLEYESRLAREDKIEFYAIGVGDFSPNELLVSLLVAKAVMILVML